MVTEYGEEHPAFGVAAGWRCTAIHFAQSSTSE